LPCLLLILYAKSAPGKSKGPHASRSAYGPKVKSPKQKAQDFSRASGLWYTVRSCRQRVMTSPRVFAA
jgi:hypothetical protein